MGKRRRQKGPAEGRYDALIEVFRSERPDLDDETYRFVISLMELGRLVETFFTDLTTARFGLNVGEARLLLALRRSVPSYSQRPTDLFNALLITSGAVTKQVDRLIAKELCERRPDPLHAGGSLIHLTEAGFAVADGVLFELDTNFRPAQVMKEMPEDARSRGVGFLEHMVRRMEDELRLARDRGHEAPAPEEGANA